MNVSKIVKALEKFWLLTKDYYYYGRNDSLIPDFLALAKTNPDQFIKDLNAGIGSKKIREIFERDSDEWKNISYGPRDKLSGALSSASECFDHLPREEKYRKLREYIDILEEFIQAAREFGIDYDFERTLNKVKAWTPEREEKYQKELERHYLIGAKEFYPDSERLLKKWPLEDASKIIKALERIRDLLKDTPLRDNKFLPILLSDAKNNPKRFINNLLSNELWGGAGAISEGPWFYHLPPREARKKEAEFGQAIIALVDAMEHQGIFYDRAKQVAKFKKWKI